MTSEARLARAAFATMTTFGLMGAVSAVWVVRIPALRDKFGLTESQVGLEVLAWGLGALVAMQFSTRLLGRYGSHRVLRVAVPASVAGLLLLAFAPGFGFLLAGGLLFGGLFGLVDVAANAQASYLERVGGRPLMGRMHAGWSLGAVVGGLLGSGLAAAGLGFTPSVGLAAVIALVPAVHTAAHFLPEAPSPAAAGGRARRARLPRPVLVLGALMFCAFLAEGAVADWSGLHLHDGLGASEAVAALGYPAFELAMLGGRLLCDRLTGRCGARLLLTGAGLAGAAGFALFVAASSAPLAVAGLVLVGAAVCVVVPLTFSLAGLTGGEHATAAIARAGTLGYCGLLLGPVAIGLVAEHTSLRTGFLLLVPVCLAIAGGAWSLPDLRVPAHPDTTGTKTALHRT
ncbi:MFS transporter [Streptomyces sp. NBC_01264]|uniref:MFS transporter n=1 Tax=Streptomyces sp. NBC_01264 TaxID=2903804 RepID=UPI00224D1687|nr:MFS transporter [Streptomyces sp. NBC_01264]MCX4781798.1 MFS transporter [Streptomyces sp. NBC_01264]